MKFLYPFKPSWDFKKQNKTLPILFKNLSSAWSFAIKSGKVEDALQTRQFSLWPTNCQAKGEVEKAQL